MRNCSDFLVLYAGYVWAPPREQSWRPEITSFLKILSGTSCSVSPSQGDDACDTKFHLFAKNVRVLRNKLPCPWLSSQIHTEFSCERYHFSVDWKYQLIRKSKRVSLEFPLRWNPKGILAQALAIERGSPDGAQMWICMERLLSTSGEVLSRYSTSKSEDPSQP